MNIKPHIQDRASEEFFALLEDGKFQSTFCSNCNKIHYPPRIVCPNCLSEELNWVDLPREGELLAFTSQDQALRCALPDVLGAVYLEDIGNILARIDAPFESLSIGQKVTFDSWKSPDGLALFQFRPVD